MARGRPPKPTALKVLQGTRSDRVNSAEPKSLAGRPDCPAHLDSYAKEEWDRIVPELEQLGVLSRTDRSSLALYCDAYSEWIRAKEDIQAYGLLIETGMGGYKANPAVTIARQAKAQMHRLLAEFGGTPSSRSRLKTGGDDGPKDALGEFLQRKRG